MGVARQTPTTATSRLVYELKAKRQDKGEDTLNKCFAVTQELKVGRFVLKIDSDGPVYACRCSCFAHVSPPGHRIVSADQTQWG